MHGLVRGVPPALDLERESARCSGCSLAAAGDGLIQSAHDCAEGGLAVTLAECCFGTGDRAPIADLPSEVAAPLALVTSATLFGESASRVVVSVAAGRAAELLALASACRGCRPRRSAASAATGFASSVDGRAVLDELVDGRRTDCGRTRIERLLRARMRAVA